MKRLSGIYNLIEDQEECACIISCMIQAYDGVGTFSEFVKRYAQEHPSKYDFTIMAQFVIPLSDPRYRSEKEKIMSDKIEASELTPIEIELVTMPYACFSVKLQEVTFDAIQQALEQAYLTMRVNPLYLFCSENDRKLFVMRTGLRNPKESAKEIAQLLNQTTGKLMHIITLPELEDGTLLFGFFTY